MGHAAYMRGSLAISAQFCRDTGCHGCIRCRPDGPTPTLRPPGWGDKARSRAEDHARRMIAGAERNGLGTPTLEVLTLAVQSAARVGADTARAAAEAALAGAACPVMVSGMTSEKTSGGG